MKNICTDATISLYFQLCKNFYVYLRERGVHETESIHLMNMKEPLLTLMTVIRGSFVISVIFSTGLSLFEVLLWQCDINQDIS